MTTKCMNNTFLFNMASMYHEISGNHYTSQCPADGWYRHIYRFVMRIVDDEKQVFGDDDRLYITGYSMGGGGTWI